MVADRAKRKRGEAEVTNEAVDKEAGSASAADERIGNESVSDRQEAEKNKTPASSTRAGRTGKRRKEASSPDAFDKGGKETSRAKVARRGDDTVKETSGANDGEERDLGSDEDDVQKKPIGKVQRGKAKVKGTSSKSSGRVADIRHADQANISRDPLVVKVPSSVEILNELKLALEEGMREIDVGRAVVADAEEELRVLEVQAEEIKKRISAQESNTNRITRRLKQTAKKLQEQAVNTNMLTTTMVTKAVKRASKSKEPALAEVAATCTSILAEWIAMVKDEPEGHVLGAANVAKEEKKSQPVTANKDALTSKSGPVSVADEPAISAPDAGSVPEPSSKVEGKKASGLSVITDILGKKVVAQSLRAAGVAGNGFQGTGLNLAATPYAGPISDRTRLKVIGWFTERIGASAAQSIEAMIFNVSAEASDGYKRCFKVASNLMAQESVPEGHLRKILLGWNS